MIERASRDERRTCSRWVGEAVLDRAGAVSVLECGDCGNVPGLADGTFDADDGPGGGLVRTDEVTATDGELVELVALLRTEAATERGSERSLVTDRLLTATDEATLEVRAAGGDGVEIREIDPGDDRGAVAFSHSENSRNLPYVCRRTSGRVR